MTNTLHRQGDRESLKKDYVIFAHTAKGITREGSAPKLQEFMRICLKYHPVNMGDSKQGNMFQDDIYIEKLISNQEDGAGATVVFTDLDTLRKVVEELIRADLGISIIHQWAHGGSSGLLPKGGNRETQCRTLPRLLGSKGPAAGKRNSRIQHLVRPWHGLVQPHPEND